MRGNSSISHAPTTNERREGERVSDRILARVFSVVWLFGAIGAISIAVPLDKANDPRCMEAYALGLLALVFREFFLVLFERIGREKPASQANQGGEK